MTHPEELLADLVAGRLSPADRATVETHLASCDRCRREVALATAARETLVSIGEVAPPAGLRPAIEEAARTRTPVSVASMQRRYRILGIAAAAAVVALLAITLPRLGGPSATSGTHGEALAPAAAGSSPHVPASLSLEVQRIDYNPTSIAALVARSVFSSETNAPLPKAGEHIAPRSDAVAAVACLDRAFPGFTGSPARLIRATFQGRPAYLGIYLEGPSAGLPAGARSVRVASIDTCTALSVSRVHL